MYTQIYILLVYIHGHKYTRHAYMHTLVCIRIANMCISVSLSLYVSLSLSVYICVYICIYNYTYIHRERHVQKKLYARIAIVAVHLG